MKPLKALFVGALGSGLVRAKTKNLNKERAMFYKSRNDISFLFFVRSNRTQLDCQNNFDDIDA